MNQIETPKFEQESLAAPERIDGRAWLRQIFRENKPRLLYKLDDEEKIGQIRKAIEKIEIAFLIQKEEVIPDEILLGNIAKQRQRDLEAHCPGLANKYIKERR